MKINLLLELKDVEYIFRRSSHGDGKPCPGLLTLFQAGAETPICFLKWKARTEDTAEEEERNRDSIDSQILLMDGVDSEIELLLHLSDVSSFKVAQCDDKTQITIIEKDGKNHKPLIMEKDQFATFLEVISQHLAVKSSSCDPSLFIVLDRKVADMDSNLTKLDLIKKSSPTRSNQANLWTFVNDMQNDPYSTALTAFSKITDKFIFGDSSAPASDYFEVLQNSLGFVDDNLMCRQDEEDFEVILSKPKFVDNLTFKERESPLSLTEWDQYLQPDGSIHNVQELKRRIYRGGVEPQLRSDVWKYLLGMHEWELTNEQKEDLRQVQVKDYFRMKLQWKSMSEDQENRFTAFRERKTQVEKDAIRTDRAHEFYQGEENISRLYDILMTHVLYDFDLGYIQGMSDLLSPILFVIRNEADAFWCFVGFMNKVKSNFDFDQAGIKRQLIAMHDLVKALDPELYVYLVSKEAENFFFCFRWLLIWFKREFSFEDIMTLWEVMWTDLPCKNYHLLMAVSLLHIEKPTIISNKFGFSEILKHMNDSKPNLKKMLQTAEAIHDKLAQENYLNDRVRELLVPL